MSQTQIPESHEVAPAITMCVRPYGEVDWPLATFQLVPAVACLTVSNNKQSEHFGQELKEHTTSMSHMLSRTDYRGSVFLVFLSKVFLLFIHIELATLRPRT